MTTPDVAPTSSDPSDVRAAAEPRTQSAETSDEFVKSPDDDDQTQDGEVTIAGAAVSGGDPNPGMMNASVAVAEGEPAGTSWEGGSTETTASVHGSWDYQGRDDYEEEPRDPWADGRDSALRGRDSRLRHREGAWPEHPQDRRDYGDNQVVWDGWRHYAGGPQIVRSDDAGTDFGTRPTGRASEKLAVPTFSGDDGEDMGNSARSYLRELPQSQQGLVLYRHLSGKAWVAAEELSVDMLGRNDGVQYLLGWLRDRYLDLEVTRIGKAFSDMFRKLKRRSGQSVRDYNSEYDRLHARLRETGCRLPEECAAWLYVDRLNLEENAELNLLASVGNEYSLGKLQKAAIIQDRGLRKPWEGTDDFENLDDIPEEVAVAYVTYQSAKNRYRDQVRNRGYQGHGNAEAGTAGNTAGKQGRGDESSARDEKIRLMKSRSFCSSCGKKGHWHKDKECPNNNNGASADGPKDMKMCNIMPAQVLALRHVGGGDHLLAIADTACARTVAGTQWVQDYMDKLPPDAPKPCLLRECEAYRFGTGKIMYSSFYVVISFVLGQKVVRLRTSVINGDIPLLVSRTVLSKLGMIYDIEQGTADFTKVGLSGFELMSTASGHPAIPIIPVVVDGGKDSVLPVEEPGLESREPYTAFAVGFNSRAEHMYNIYHDKKLVAISKMTKTQLLEEALRLGLTVHKSWSPEEIKAIIMEHRVAQNEKDATVVMKKVSQLTLPELKKKAQSLNIDFPASITKGNLLRLVRDSLNTPDNELMKIREFREIPHQYGVWAVNEVKSSGNADDELIRFARWFENKQHENKGYASSDVGSSLPGPYPGTESSAGSSWRGVWEENLPTRAVNMGEKPTRDRPKRPTVDTDSAYPEKDMDDEPDADTLAEIQKLETRLALLKDKARTKSGK
ncbi:GIP [Symbiodinium sp. CCMP2592]|nr:GIP [Symbiodinium sp. CCMP2592]